MVEAAIWIAVMCNMAAAGVLLKGASLYGLRSVPLPHHKRMFRNAGIEVTPVLRLLMRSLYRAIACSFLGLAIAVIVLNFGPILQGMLWAKLLVLTIGLLMAVGAVFLPREVELLTGVPMPWRNGVFMGLLFLVGFLFAVLADDRVQALLD